MKNKLKGLRLTDRISVPTKRTFTDAGQMIVPCAFARVGALTYKGSQLGLVDQADELFEVHRKEEDVFDEASMESFRSAPVTMGHPTNDDGKSIQVTAENAKDLQVGMLEGMPVRDEDLLTGTLVIANQEAIDSIEEGTVELSAGYTCDVYEDEGVYYQRNIKANHIAIVEKGRAGSNCSIADEAENEQSDVPNEKNVGKAVGKVVEKDVDVSDMNEADAANLVAEKEEQETEWANMDAEMMSKYAQDAEMMAKAHAEVAKAARKIANKKAKSMSDEADQGGDFNLTDDVTSILVAVDVADEAIAKLEALVADNSEKMEAEVVARCDVILLARSMTDINDFAGKTVNEIKSLVVADVLDLNLSDKNEAYIDARFDILCEDSDDMDTPMGRLLKKQVLTDVTPVAYVDPVSVARLKMIERNNKQGNK